MPGVTVEDRAHVEVTTYASVFTKISPGVVLESECTKNRIVRVACRGC